MRIKFKAKTFNQGPGCSCQGKGRGRHWNMRSTPHPAQNYPQSQFSALQVTVLQQTLTSIAQHKQPQLHQQIYHWRNFWYQPISATTYTLAQHPFNSEPLKGRQRQQVQKRPGQMQQLSFMSIPLPEGPVGGRLRYFLAKWSQITSDPSVLKMITGMEIDLWKLPKQATPPSPLHFNEKETADTDTLTQELLSKNTITTSGKEQGHFISTIFLCHKPNGSYYMILNLKKFNKYVDYCKFKMDTLIKILALVMPEMYMCNLDLNYS